MTPQSRTRAHLVLADGEVFTGWAMGASGNAIGEAVFTTGMTGYQEVLTDPSYCGQIVTMTAPQIGNTGVCTGDEESKSPALSALVVHELSPVTSNWRSEATLEQYLEAHHVVGITGLDTRSLTRHIRGGGAQMAAVGTGPVEELLELARKAPPMSGRDLASEVTTGENYRWTEGSGEWKIDSGGHGLHVVAVDFGIKHNILRCLVDLGCTITVVPAQTRADEIMALKPDGVFLSNGPGDPAAVSYAIETVKDLLGQAPIFGICLGHQLLALALGAQTFKLKFGHRGLNHPVQDLSTGKVEVTTQNHGFAVDTESLTEGCELSHVHLNDQTCQGFRHDAHRAFGVQFHPEAAAGPHDSRYLFDRFVGSMTASAR